MTEAGKRFIEAALQAKWGDVKMTCLKCNVEMKRGMALAQTYVSGMPDFPGETHASTFSAGGPGKLVDCWKCPQCGRSVTNDPA